MSLRTADEQCRVLPKSHRTAPARIPAVLRRCFSLWRNLGQALQGPLGPSGPSQLQPANSLGGFQDFDGYTESAPSVV